MMNNHLISIVGATGIGKTALSIQIAQHYICDIISSDSRQFYKELTIGTAVPEPFELAAVKHHFIQNKSIFDEYSVGHFERDALLKLNTLFEKNNFAVMVGGSGLYVDSVLKGLDYFPDIDPEIRIKLNKQLETEGIKSLQEELKKLDADSFKTIELENPHRLIRALEICIGTDKPYSFYKNKPKEKRNFKPIKIGLTADRELLYARIEKRVDTMMKMGLLDEVKKLHKNKNVNALQTVGYRELFRFIDGEIDLDFAVSEIKKNTRRFAKRQGTWFRKDLDIKWFDYKTNPEEIIEYINSKNKINY